MANSDVTITNDTNSKQFIFRGVNSFKPKKVQPVSAIPLVNTTPGNNALFRFTGQQEEVTFSFAIFDDGTDVSNGTGGSVINTVAEQIQYLKDDVYTEDYADTWTLYDNHDLVYPNTGSITCVITNLEFDLKQGAATVVMGTCSVIRGRLISV